MRLLSFMLGISWKEKHGGIFPEGAQLRDRTASSACNNLASDCQFSSSNIKQYKHGSVERGWGWGEINGVNFCLEITFITSVTLKLGPVRYDNQEQKPLSFFFFWRCPEDAVHIWLVNIRPCPAALTLGILQTGQEDRLTAYTSGTVDLTGLISLKMGTDANRFSTGSC